MIFQEKKRSYNGTKSYVECDFDYLDRSARTESNNVRDFLNHWATQLPKSDANELISRIKSGNKKNFESATFELILFAIMNKLGCAVEIHPNLNNGSTKHPDFLVRTPAGEEFYLEAVLASEFNKVELAAEKRKNVVLESIEQLKSPNFLLGIDAEGNPDSPPQGKKLRTSLEKWLENLDPDLVAKEIDEKGFDAVPTMDWDHDNWNVTFQAIPIKPERRGIGQRVIGTIFGGAKWSNGWEPIGNAIKAKGKHYRGTTELDKPLIVAVSVDGFSLDKIDEMQALFGQEEYVFSRDNPNSEPEMRRASNGAWHGKGGVQYTRVSGAWLFDSLTPWNIISRKNTLYFNPWAAIELPKFLEKLNHASAINEKMEWKTGITLRDILDLSEYWPEKC